MDATRERILPGAAHTRADREVAYRVMHFAAELLRNAGAGAILDAPYGHAEDRAELARLDPFLVECRVSAATAVRRFRARGPDGIRLDLTEDLVRALAETYPYSGLGLTLDTETLTVEQSVALVEEAVR
jgi:predicted kinase